jgi:hypothetical protein
MPKVGASGVPLGFGEGRTPLFRATAPGGCTSKDVVDINLSYFVGNFFMKVFKINQLQKHTKSAV